MEKDDTLNFKELSKGGCGHFITNEFLSDVPLYYIILIFCIFSWLTSAALDQSHVIRRNKIFDRDDIQNVLWIMHGVFTLFAIFTFFKIAAEASRSPINDFFREMRFVMVRGPATVILLFGMLLFIDAFSSLKALLPKISLIWADEYLATIDRRISGGHDAWDLLFYFRDADLLLKIQSIYVYGWSMAVFLISAIASFCRRPMRHKYFLTFFLTWIIQGLFIPVLLFSGGPAFYGVFTGDFDQFEKISKFLEAFKDSEHSTYNVQSWLLDLYLADQSQLGSGISAFPSVHVALAFLFTLFAWPIHFIFGIFMAGFCGIIMIGAVLLGWHYAIDGYVAIVLELIIWKTCEYLLKKKEPFSKET